MPRAGLGTYDVPDVVLRATAMGNHTPSTLTVRPAHFESGHAGEFFLVRFRQSRREDDPGIGVLVGEHILGYGILAMKARDEDNETLMITGKDGLGHDGCATFEHLNVEGGRGMLIHDRLCF